MIERDKALHAIAGALIAFAAAFAAAADGFQSPSLIGLLASVVAGAAKELWDYWQNWRARRAGRPEPHGVEFADWIATSAGGFVVSAAIMLGGA